MPQLKKLLLATAGCLALFSAGCNSTGTAKRIQEKAEVFALLTPIQQEQIEHGGIEPGYTQDMVYMALGQPTTISTSANGRDTTWVYKNYSPPSGTPQANFQWSHGVTSSPSRNYTSREAGNVSTGNAAVPQIYQGKSLSDASAVGPEPSMEVPDLPIGTFFVTFRRNRVIDMRLDQ